MNLSFWPSGMTTSLMSGLPRRETWTHAPASVGGAPVEESVDVWRRQVDDHMLTMAFGSAGSVGAVWLAVSFSMGTDRAIEWTL